MKKTVINTLVISLSLVALSIITILYLGRSTLNVEIKVVDAIDSGQINRFDTLLLVVTNHETFTIHPQFWVISNIQGSKFWEIVKGPTALGPGETSEYLIRATSASVSIEPNDTFFVMLIDNDDDYLWARSGYYRFDIGHFVGIQNPGLGYPTYDVSKGLTEPFAWDYTYHTEAPGEVHLYSITDQGIYLAVWNITRRSGNWLMSGIQQVVDFPEVLEITVKPMCNTPVSPYPLKLAGVELADGYRRIWVIFTNTTSEPILLRRYGALVYALYYVPVKMNQWNTIVVNISSIYREMGWGPPPETTVIREGRPYLIRAVNLLLFVAEYPGSGGELCQAYFKSVRENSPLVIH